MQSIRLQRKSHQNAQLYLTTMRYLTADTRIHTDTVVEVVAVVARRAAYMKNPTDVVPVAAEVVGRRVVTEDIVTDVVLDHQMAAAKTSKKKEKSSLVKQLERILLYLLFSFTIFESIFCRFRKDNQIV